MAEAEATKTPPVLKRPRTTFTIPAEARTFPDDPRKLTFVPVSLQEELDAHRVVAAQGGGMAVLNAELVKRSVVAIDGKTVDWSTTAPEWYERASPKVRDLALDAFVRVNRVTSEAQKAFLDSAETVAE